MRHGDDLSPPRASVIVLTRDRPIALRRCLDSLAAQSLAPQTFEVVVVDVSDTPARDVVDAATEGLRLVYRATSNAGVAGNRNAGVALARGAVIAFLDDDCVADSRWLELMVAAVEQDPRCLTGGRVRNASPSNSIAVAGQVIAEGVDGFFNPTGAEARFVPGVNFAVDRERYLRIGGCDARFGRLAAEDRDLVDRWRLAGGRVRVHPDAIVHHEHRSTLQGFVRQHVNYGRGAWRYHRVRARRRSGRMRDDLGLHLALHRHMGPQVMRLDRSRRPQVLALLLTWHVANLAGFVAQAVSDTIDRSARAAGDR